TRAQPSCARGMEAPPAPCGFVVVPAVARVAPVPFEREREDDTEEPGRSERPLPSLRTSKRLVLLLRRELVEANRALAERAEARSHQLLMLREPRLPELPAALPHPPP